jgi:hypothetical protein
VRQLLGVVVGEVERGLCLLYSPLLSAPRFLSFVVQLFLLITLPPPAFSLRLRRTEVVVLQSIFNINTDSPLSCNEI